MNLLSKWKVFRARVGSNHWRILRGMLYVATFVFLGKIAGAAKEMGMAWRYGVGEIVDVYVFSVVIISWFPSVLTSVLNAVYVPLSRRLSVEENKQFSSELTGFVLLLSGLLVATLIFGLAPASLRIANEMQLSTPDDLSRVIQLLAPAGGFMFIAALYSARLLASERHVNTLLECIPALILLAFILAMPGHNKFMPLVAGTLVGVLLHVLLLAWFTHRAEMSLHVSWRFTHPAWREFRGSFSILVVGTLIMSVVPIVDQMLAARLPDNAISSLSYSARLLAVALGLGATAVARSILPVLSDQDNTVAQRVKLARQWFLLLFVGGLLASVIGWLATPFAVKLIYERGAFLPEDTERVVQVVRYGLSQLPFYFSSIVLVQLCASLGYYKMIVWSSLLAIVVKMTTGIPLSTIYGVKGITLSTAIMYFANCIYFLIAIGRLHRREAG